MGKMFLFPPQDKSRLLLFPPRNTEGGGFSTLVGEIIQIDDYIFQMGWFNHQIEMILEGWELSQISWGQPAIGSFTIAWVVRYGDELMGFSSGFRWEPGDGDGIPMGIWATKKGHWLFRGFGDYATQLYWDYYEINHEKDPY